MHGSIWLFLSLLIFRCWLLFLLALPFALPFRLPLAVSRRRNRSHRNPKTATNSREGKASARIIENGKRNRQRKTRQPPPHRKKKERFMSFRFPCVWLENFPSRVPQFRFMFKPAQKRKTAQGETARQNRRCEARTEQRTQRKTEERKKVAETEEAHAPCS